MPAHGAARHKAHETSKRTNERRWTTSQLERKRQQDKEAQRISRARTKNRIAELESLVTFLKANGSEQVQKLYSLIERQQREINELQNVIDSVAKLTSRAKLPPAPDFAASETLKSVEVLPDVPVGSMNGENVEGMDLLWSNTLGLEEILAMQVSEQHNLCDKFQTTTEPTCKVTKPSQSVSDLAAVIADKKHLDGRLWYLASGVLNHILQLPDLKHPIITAYDEDIAIRAVFKGWPAVVAKYDLDVGWQWLRELDERLYFHASKPDRLMHLRNTRLVFLRQLLPNNGFDSQVPEFFRPSPSEQHVAHDPLIEHFPWPAFRYRLLFEPSKFATNTFMDALRMHLGFTWDRDPNDMYILNASTGLYGYAHDLLRNLADIRCYTAKRGLFDHFPELRADIPCSAVLLRELLPCPPLSFLDGLSSDDCHEDEESE